MYDQDGAVAVFRDLSASLASIEAARNVAAYGASKGNRVMTSDGVQAYTQALLGESMADPPTRRPMEPSPDGDKPITSNDQYGLVGPRQLRSGMQPVITIPKDPHPYTDLGTRL